MHYCYYIILWYGNLYYTILYDLVSLINLPSWLEHAIFCGRASETGPFADRRIVMVAVTQHACKYKGMMCRLELSPVHNHLAEWASSSLEPPAAMNFGPAHFQMFSSRDDDSISLSPLSLYIYISISISLSIHIYIYTHVYMYTCVCYSVVYLAVRVTCSRV